MSIKSLKKQIGKRHLVAFYVDEEVLQCIKDMSTYLKQGSTQFAYGCMMDGIRGVVSRISKMEMERMAKEEAAVALTDMEEAALVSVEDVERFHEEQGGIKELKLQPEPESDAMAALKFAFHGSQKKTNQVLPEPGGSTAGKPGLQAARAMSLWVNGKNPRSSDH